MESQNAVDEFECRVVEMMQGMEDLLKKQDRKIAVLLGQNGYMEKVEADKPARLSRLHLRNPTLHLMNPILYLMNGKLQEIQDELKKINEEASDMVLEVEQKYNDETQSAVMSESDGAKLEATRQELEEMKLHIQERESTVDELCLAFEKLLQDNNKLFDRF
ncbi:PREDICTED: uncharacterized protein LOC109161763 [Ipomoea nil]|uniref:uncharacterized protein LOC109161763 n=1 Tax=Ipomoea nil TaxID=35883 RepID=UPI0009010DE5|nr:PREDICTED: uncharacterized protein LOC109161763 [Ipomoea nil]